MKNKPWYIWILAIVFWPFTLSILIWKKKDLSAPKRIGALIGLWVLVFIVQEITGSSSSDVNNTNATALAQTPTPEPASDPVAFASQDVSEATIKQALSNIRKVKDAKIDVLTLDDGKHIVHIYYTFTAWDDVDIVKTSARTSVDVYRKLFENPQIAEVGMIAEQDFTDQYGQEKTLPAVTFIMYRETADKVNWDNISDMVLLDYKALLPLTDYSIHQSIENELIKKELND